MTTEVRVPKLGFSVDEVELTEWLVQDGDVVTTGQTLYLMESQKSSEEVESPGSGTVKIIESAGQTLAVGTLIATIE
ncbi:biotin/lipoyl-containing protein [Pseudomonas sp. NFX224]|uniref:biotin/lipoyl-containing protein n=1 Tax=Pseudomonas sp. NFX224 TaxID=3402862 RepID=UPI003AFAEAE0